MDKYEYKVRAEEIKSLIAEGEFAEAVKIADTIDWHRVKSVMMLCTVSDLYKINRRFQESKDILLMAYERHPGGRLIVYSLCELSVKMGEFVQAIEYYKEFVQIAPKDTGRYILQYKLYEAQDVSLEERIAVLEEFKKRDYREKWAYELAYLYHRVGLETKCAEECDEMILWFGEGRYVLKALELKMIHHPLTPSQQEKYFLMKNGAAEVPEEEIRVKTVDVGQYNTINLQKALAESMKEILGEEEPEEEETTSMGSITESIVAPLLQETEELPEAAADKELINKELINKEIINTELPELQPATEEVFFEEDVKDVLLEDTKEIDLGEIAKVNLGDTKELNPGRRIVYPSVTPEAFRAEKAVAPQTNKEPDAAGRQEKAEPEEIHAMHGPRLMQMHKPSGFEQMLSQEYDGQISLAITDKNDIEKQITGQMNITDIMAEWERMKRENEEKRREDVRKRVQQHTGNMFSDFDEATKTGLFEQLEKAVVEAILKESEDRKISPEDITTQKLSDIVHDVEKQKNGQKTAEDLIRENIAATAGEPQPEPQAESQSVAYAAEQEVRIEPETDAEAAPDRKETAPEAEESAAEKPAGITEVSIDTGIINLEAAVVEETARDLAELQKTAEEKTEQQGKVRSLTDEEKELFGRFVHNKKAREQVIHAVDTMSMDSYTDNVIVTGEEGSGSLEMAKNLIRMLQISDSNFSGKVAKISGTTLNKKDAKATLAKLVDGALIIEHATAMSSNTATELNKALAQENNGLFVIMEGKKDEMNIFLRKNFVLMENFNARVDIESLDDQSLVEYARQYAEEQEYSIDELGILALHTRIADMQTSDHEVTIAEVKDLVDDAIYFADKKNPKHFFDILFAKRYDEEDMVILREKDFMHY